MIMEEKWFGRIWTKEEETLINLIEKNGELFEDMLFSKDTISHTYIAVKSSYNNVDTWVDDEIAIPDQLAYFSYTFFDFHVQKIDDGSIGCFNMQEQSITIDPGYLHDESTILHEMIHLHEYVLNELPLFYHDAYFYCLYKSLQSKIVDLDERIEAHGHLLNEQQLYSRGGLHDILFLLKSFDLDLKMGYKLGSVMGYGYK